MALPDESPALLRSDHRPRYEDPQLWLRLGPRIVAHCDQKMDELASTFIQSHEVYARRFGYLEGLRWVLAEARELNKGDAD